MGRTGLSVPEVIGATPIVFLSRMAEGLSARIAVKMESLNPGGSVKDRIGLGMVADAEARGVLHPGMTIVEPTSGNTGIALAMIGAARGYRVKLTMPESMSVERRRLLAAYGAELVLTPAARGMLGAVEEAEALLASSDDAYMPGQFDNPANPRTHYDTTGAEVLAAFPDGEPGALVSAVGTGGTISGVGGRLRDAGLDTRIVAVEPEESPVITQTREGRPLQTAPHPIQGIGAGFIPGTLDLDLIDEVQTVSGAEAIAIGRRLAAEEGMMAGISTGANVAVALRLAARPELAGRTILTFACSTGERYLSTPLWEGVG